MVDAVMLDFLFGSNMHLVQLIAIQYNGRNARLSIALPLTTHHAPNSTLHYLLWMRQVRWHARLGTYSRPCRRPLNQPTLARRHARWTGHVWSPERSRQQLGRTGRVILRCCILLPLLHVHSHDDEMTQISDHAAAPNRWPVLLCLFPMAAPSYPSAGQGSLWCVYLG